MIVASGRPKILVLGDLILDSYLHGHVTRPLPDEAGDVFLIDRSEERLGGAGGVAMVAQAMGAEVTLATVIGGVSDEACRMAMDLAKRHGIRRLAFVEEYRRTPLKTRRVEDGKLLPGRIDLESVAPIGESAESWLCQKVLECGRFDAVCISDYAKGVVTPETMLAAVGVTAAGRVLVDAKPSRPYPSGAIRKYSLDDARAAADEPQACPAMLADKLFGDGRGIVTAGKAGMAYRDAGETVWVDAATASEVDATGAGDTVLAALGVYLGQGKTLAEAVEVARVAAAIQVESLGIVPVTMAQIQARQADSLSKVLSIVSLLHRLRDHRRNGQRIVFTNGCFDLLHQGHVATLEAARAQGDVLVVAVNTDASVRRLKGPDRPVVPEAERARLVAAMGCVNYVILMDQDTPLPLLHVIRPDVLVKGGVTGDVVGRMFVEQYGGRVVVGPMVPSVSTTQRVECIQQQKALHPGNGHC
jgi:D-beta-D-heptose 7-phosphate kinase/D-beta-D-heptose 1-phosphate adenosyltransferase